MLKGKKSCADRCAGRRYIFKFTWAVEAVSGRQMSRSVRKNRCNKFCSSYTIYVRKNTALPESEGVVEVTDDTLFQADAQKIQCTDLVEDTSRVFGLCLEQDRAFRIIANHAAGGHPQLKIYIGDGWHW